jgi:hypothetical protein
VRARGEIGLVWRSGRSLLIVRLVPAALAPGRGRTALGLAGSLWAAQFVGPLLFQVESRDPVTFAGAAGVLVATAVLAAWLPARRAARLDPATVLREG